MIVSGGSAKLDALTSMRLVAALVVVVYHARGSLLPLSVMVPGAEAVSFFFVLSGFILAYAYHKRSYSLRGFYLARLARILPASVLSIAVFILLINPSLLSLNLPITVANLLLIQSAIPIPAYYFALNAVLWSVSVEAFFYFSFPALEHRLHTMRGRILLFTLPFAIGLLMIALASYWRFPFYSISAFNAITGHGLIYISPMSRLKEFTVGMLAGGVFLKVGRQIKFTPSRRVLFSVIEVLSVVALIFCLSILKPFHDPSLPPSIAGIYFSQSVMAILFAWVILVFAIQGGLFSRVLSHKALVIGGEISFSIYLFHQMLIVWQHNNPWFLGWCPLPYRFAVFIVLILGISYGVWRWFECPMRARIRRVFNRRS
jgi:peptidoglycan/LPS O-acetylase OafA/YrhL